MAKRRIIRGRRRKHDEKSEKPAGAGQVAQAIGAAAAVAAGLAARRRAGGSKASWSPRRMTTGQQREEMLAKTRDQPRPADNLEAHEKTPSGAGWLSKFPVSTSPADLDATFASNMVRFIGALTAGGAMVERISSRIPLQRAYLMHWAWRIARGDYDPRQVPSMVGVHINWWHGDIKTSRAAAEEMVRGYKLTEHKSPPPVVSPYTQGKVMVIRLFWEEKLNIKDPLGNEHLIEAAPRNGANNDLAEIAKTFRILRLTVDRTTEQVHWLAGGEW